MFIVWHERHSVKSGSRRSGRLFVGLIEPGQFSPGGLLSGVQLLLQSPGTDAAVAVRRMLKALVDDGLDGLRSEAFQDGSDLLFSGSSEDGQGQLVLLFSRQTDGGSLFLDAGRSLRLLNFLALDTHFSLW